MCRSDDGDQDDGDQDDGDQDDGDQRISLSPYTVGTCYQHECYMPVHVAFACVQIWQINFAYIQ